MLYTMRRGFTQDEQEQIITMYQQNVSQSEIGRHFGVSRQMVNAFLHRYAVQGYHKGARPKLTPAECNHIHEWYNRDKAISMPQLAKLFRVSTPTIQKILDYKPPYTRAYSQLIDDGGYFIETTDTENMA